MPERLPCNEGDPTNAKVRKFIREYRQTAEKLANKLKVPVENILGLSGEETGFGTSNIASKAHNFFGMHKGAPGNIGTFITEKGAEVSKYPANTGFLSSGESFIKKFGSLVRGKADPKSFAEALIPSFNSGNDEDGGNSNFIQLVKNAIDSIKFRINCKDDLKKVDEKKVKSKQSAKEKPKPLEKRIVPKAPKKVLKK